MLKLLLIGFFSVFLISCSSSPKDELVNNKDAPARELFTKAENALEARQYKTAAKLFDEVERLYPYSEYANKAQLLAGEASYQDQEYDDAILALDRFLELHPGSSEVPYAYYLKALCYYEQISDIERDQNATTNAREALKEVYMRFPTSLYANDAKLKYDLTQDHLAGKEMNVGRYYLNRNEYIGAMNRFNVVVDTYQTSSHTPEALYRLVEIYIALKMHDDALKTAAVLGHNFSNSQWYKMAYDMIKAKGLGL